MPLKVEIVTPDRRAHEGVADSVTLPTSLGSIGILPGHIPLTALIAAGEVVLNQAGTITRLAIDRGFVRLVGDKVSVVTEGAIDSARIDLSSLSRLSPALSRRWRRPRTRRESIPLRLPSWSRSSATPPFSDWLRDAPPAPPINPEKALPECIRLGRLFPQPSLRKHAA
jgi:F-type H+-transporting ATPase subunit epsilon